MDLKSLRTRLARIGATVTPSRRPRKLTTAEGRQELDRILAKLDPNAPPPTQAQLTENAPAYAELDRILVEMDAREAAAS
jgi:hypothetical protein